MQEREFNLLHEPWIRVLHQDCTVQEVSLLTLFEQAHTYRGLGGELPTQNVAVLRLLLAVLHAVFARVDMDGAISPINSEEDALERWKALWDAKQFPAELITNYLLRYEERFWLFDPERPFYQVPAAENGTAYGTGKLNGALSESSNKGRLFPMCSSEVKETLSYAEAARWLLYVNGFDDTSAKAKQREPKLPSPGVGWLGKLGLLTAVGKNLFETLLLNFVLLKNGTTLWDREVPLWEKEKIKAAERTEIACPNNPSELLTLQSRRLLLKRENQHVVGYALLGGDFFDKTLSDSEQMTLWRIASKKDEVPIVIQPKRHDASRQMWRDFSALFATDNHNRRPGVIAWLARLEREELLCSKQLCFQIDSVQYGDKDFFVADVFTDSLSLHADLLTQLGSSWMVRIQDEVARLDQIAGDVASLAKNLVRAESSSNGNAKANSAKAQFYYRIDMPFREWLQSIAPDENAFAMDPICLAWHQIAFNIANRLGKELVDEAGLQGFTGRLVKDDKKNSSQLYTAPKVYGWFLASLSKR
ncbi:MAG: type I-E CRISPR-associated protein Cse1/CasA [Clostridia bacterium]